MAKRQDKLSFGDLIAAQQRLAAQGDMRAAETLDRLTKMQKTLEEEHIVSKKIEKAAEQDKVLQAVQTVEAVKAVNDDDQIVKAVEKLEDETRKGLLDKKGDGLNANVIKLADAIKKSTQPQTSSEVAFDKGRATPEKSAAVLESRTAAAAKQYVPGTADFLKEKFSFKAPEKGAGIKGWADAFKGSIKDAFSLEKMLDMSPGKNVGGLFGGQLRRKVEQNQYVKDQMVINPMRGAKQYKDLTDEEYNTKRREDIRKQYNRNLAVRGEMKTNEAEITRMREANYSDRDINKAGLLEKREALDKSLRGKGMDAQYRQQRNADDEGLEPGKVVKRPKTVKESAQPGYKSFVAATGANETKASPADIVKSSIAGLIGTPKEAANDNKFAAEETADENLRIIGEQTTLLKKIEENTRPSAAKPVQPAAAAAPVAEAAAGGGLLGDVLSNGAGKGVLNKVKGVGTSLLKNPKLLGKVGAGLAVVGGAYTAYKGFTEASDEEAKANADVDEAVKAGKITPVEASTIKAKVADQTDVKQGSAVGEGTGMAAGGIAGMQLGATVGTMVGGPVGTVVGGAIGGAVGAVAGSAVGKKIGGSLVSGYKSVRDWWKGDEAGKAQPVAKASASMYTIANEPVVPGQKLSDNQMAVIEMAKQSGNTYPAEIEKQYSAQKATPAAVAPNTANQVYGQSGENAGMAQQAPAAAPVVINAPTTNTVANTTTQAYKTPPRNTESSYQSYNRAKYAY